MQTGSPTSPPADDDGFQRWWLGGAPGIDQDEDGLEAVALPADEVRTPAPPAERVREGWLAAAGGVAAAVLLWSFYGVVDGAVERGARDNAAVAAAPQAQPLEAGTGAAEVDTTHAVYMIPAGGEQPFYTRWR